MAAEVSQNSLGDDIIFVLITCVLFRDSVFHGSKALKDLSLWAMTWCCFNQFPEAILEAKLLIVFLDWCVLRYHLL
jgi:hypothetical protein